MSKDPFDHYPKYTCEEDWAGGALCESWGDALREYLSNFEDVEEAFANPVVVTAYVRVRLTESERSQMVGALELELLERLVLLYELESGANLELSGETLGLLQAAIDQADSEAQVYIPATERAFSIEELRDWVSENLPGFFDQLRGN